MSEAAPASFNARIVLRPRSLDETFDLAVAYLRAYFRELGRPLGLLWVLMMLPVFLVGFWGDLWAGTAVLLVVSAFTERVVTVFVGQHLFRNPITLWTALKTVIQQGLSLTLFSIFIHAPILMMIMDNEAPGIWLGLGVLVSFVWPLILSAQLLISEVMYLERESFGAALRRTSVLMRYQFGRAFGLLVLGTLVRGLFVTITWSTALFVLDFMLQFSNVAEAVGPWFFFMGYGLSSLYIALVRFFEYIDARTRREGWDIQVRFHAIAERERQKERWAA